MINKAFKNKILSFLEKNAHTKYSELVLGLIAFSEASFFLIPPDVFLIAILMYGANRWVYYASFTTVFSVLGGMFGYVIGAVFFGVAGEFLIETYNLQEAFNTVAELFNSNAFLAIFVSAFTPIPYKVFTISAGLFGINFIVFTVASILGRGIRFFLVAYVMKMFGESILKVFMKYFNAITIAVIAILLLILFL